MQEWKKELCREQPETLQELGKGTYIQRRNITPYERKDGNGEADKGYSCEESGRGYYDPDRQDQCRW